MSYTNNTSKITFEEHLKYNFIMDKGTNLFIKLTCTILSLCAVLSVSPKIESLSSCIFENKYNACSDVGLSWLYKLRN